MAKGGKGKDRDVVFRLGIASTPESKRALQELGAATLAVQRGLDRSLSRVNQVAKESTQSIAAGMQAAIRSSEQSIRSSISSMARDAQSQLDSFRRSAAAPGGVGSSPMTAPRSGEYPKPGRGPGNRPIPVPMAAGERLAQEAENFRNPVSPRTPPAEAPRRPDTFTAGMNRAEAAQRSQQDREERAEREADIRQRAAEANRAAREQAASQKREQAAAAAAQRQAEADQRKEQASIARQRAADDRAATREQSIQAKQQAAQQARDAIQRRETGNQDVQRTANVSVARKVGLPAGGADEAKFQAMALAEQEKYIAQKLQNETAVYTSIKGLRGADLAAYRQAVAQKVQSLNQMLEETKRAAGEGHAAESRAVQSTLRQRQLTIKSAISELSKYDAQLRAQAASEDAMAERLHQRHRQRQLSVARENRARRTSEVAAPAGLNTRETAAYEQAIGKINNANRAMNEPLSQVVESLGRATRGFAQLGLLSESTTEGLLKGWIRIQSVFDIALGVSKAVTGIANAQRLFSDATKASQIATTLASTASARQTAALARETTAAGLAAAAHGRLAAARAAGAVSGNAGAVASGASTLASGARVASAGAGAAGIGSAAGGAAIPAAGGAALTGMAWGAALLGATAATLSLVETIKNAKKYGFGGGAEHGSIYDQVATAEASGLGYAAEKLGSKGFDQAMQIGTGGLSNLVGDFFAPFKQLGETNLATQRAEKRAADSKANKERFEQQSTVRAGEMRTTFDTSQEQRDLRNRRRADTAPRENDASRQLKSLQREIDNTREQLDSLPVESGAGKILEGKIRTLMQAQRSLSVDSTSPELDNRQSLNKDRRLEIKRELEELSKKKTELQATGAKAEQAEVERQITALNRQQNELAHERRMVERQIADERKRSSETAIAGIRSEMDMRRQQQRELESRVQSVAERFGNLDVLEQRRLLMAKSKSNKAADAALDPTQKADFETLTGKAESGVELSDKDQQRLAELRKVRARASAAVLNRTESQSLASLGDGEGIAVDRERALDNARRTGGDVFGRDERADIGIQKAAQRKLQIELKNQTEFLVKLEANPEQLAERAVKKILPLVQAFQVDLARNVEERLQQAMAALSANQDGIRQQRALGSRR